MNYLAHAYLSSNQQEILVGNMISDFVKGKTKFNYPPGIQKGIALHRAIDEFTDTHPATKKAAAFFRPAYRLYSGAFVDVVYDHFLALDTNQFKTADDLQKFTDGVYKTLEQKISLLPLRFQKILTYMKQHGGPLLKEIIVSDAGSTDTTRQLAADAGVTVVVSPQKGRAAQMNYGATVASGDILYFIHADTFPPPSFGSDISKAIVDGFNFGRYRTQFDSDKMTLKLNAFFTRFDLFVCYGGDQTLFMTRVFFVKLYGFEGNMRIMEDYDLVVRGGVEVG